MDILSVINRRMCIDGPSISYNRIQKTGRFSFNRDPEETAEKMTECPGTCQADCGTKTEYGLRVMARDRAGVPTRVVSQSWCATCRSSKS